MKIKTVYGIQVLSTQGIVGYSITGTLIVVAAILGLLVNPWWRLLNIAPIILFPCVLLDDDSTQRVTFDDLYEKRVISIIKEGAQYRLAVRCRGTFLLGEYYSSQERAETGLCALRERDKEEGIQLILTEKSIR